MASSLKTALLAIPRAILRPARRLGRLFGSVKFGLFNLALNVLTYIAATLRYEQPEQVLRHTPWLRVLLAVLALNIIGVTAKRWPFTRLHIGMLTTHSGILTVILGSFITYYFGDDGVVQFAEGQSRATYLAEDTILRVSVPEKNLAAETLVTVDRVKRIHKGGPRLEWKEQDLAVEVLQFYPRFRASLVTEDGGPDLPAEAASAQAGGNPALEAELSIEGQPHRVWVFAGAPAAHWPVRLEYRPKATEEELRENPAGADAAAKGELVVSSPGHQEPQRIGVAANLGSALRLNPSELSVVIEQYLPHFRINLETREAHSVSEAPVNPAIHVVATLGETRMEKWLLAEKSSPHGGGKSLELGEHTLSYEFPPELRPAIATVVFSGTSGKPGKVAIWAAGQEPEIFPLERNRPYELFAPLSVSVVRILSRATQRHEYRNDSPQENPALEIELRRGEEKLRTWVRRQIPQEFTVAGQAVRVEYRNREEPLGFEIELDRFQALRYQGSNLPRAFESHVRVRDEAGERPVVISMNNPLRHKGLKLFQASYEERGDVRVSVLSVARDPGILVIYTGALLIVSGILFMFYVKPILIRRMGRA